MLKKAVTHVKHLLKKFKFFNRLQKTIGTYRRRKSILAKPDFNLIKEIKCLGHTRVYEADEVFYFFMSKQ